MSTEAVNQDAIDKLCEISDNQLNLYSNKCLESCDEVLTYLVDPEEQSGATTCLNCICDNVINPSERTIAEAREECFEICNTLGGYQFFYSFYVSPPDWRCFDN
jgi:hypothetical protein